MHERPIIFSAPMVRAILEKRKWQTRRIVKPQPAPHDGWDWSWPVTRKGVTPGTRFCWRGDQPSPNLFPYCRYGVPGDRLYVRENFRLPRHCDTVLPRDISMPARILYEADLVGEAVPAAMDAWGKLRPAIHLPRKASRIVLTLSDIRVERLQDISERDAEAEGAERLGLDDDGTFYPSPLGTFYCGFADIWSHIHGRDSWDANPWVWVCDWSERDA